ncbi:MAG: phosphatidic acid phosphatase, partial [Fulvivirga sp.]|nr:phosphatidic acid phosphatase [Fulvivirga sp.]
MITFFYSCNQKSAKINIPPQTLHTSMQQLTDVIVHDIFSPPVASRIYAYPSIAAYEVLARQDSVYKTLAGQLNRLEPIPAPAEEVNHEVAAIQAFLLV